MNARPGFLLAICLILSGCGFHLRSWELDGAYSTARVVAAERISLADPLRRALRQAGLELVDADADVVIELLEERVGRRSVSVTEQARAAEYSTSLGVRYAIHDSSADVLIEPRWIQTARVYRVDRANIVASSEEQSLLQREMVQELVQQVLRSLNAVARESSGAG